MMTRRLRLIVFVSMVASVGIAVIAPAAKLHEALQADSLERNGEPQPMEFHKGHGVVLSTLPNTELHPHAAKGMQRKYSGVPVDVLTYHNDAMRTGWNKSETDLTPATVASASFGLLDTINVDGLVLAQPLMVSNFRMPDGKKHNVLLIVTDHNSVYAYDAQSDTLLWHVNLGKSQPSADVSCDSNNEYGISSTPVIVRSAANVATVYLVSATEPAPFSFHTKLHALNLQTGAGVVPAVELAPQTMLPGGTILKLDPQNQWSRAGLAYSDGSIYVSIGAHCDNNPANTSGWLLAYGLSLQRLHRFNTIKGVADYELAGIWMSGFAPAIDTNGDIFVVTGNGNFSRQPMMRGYGESVLKISSDLKSVRGSFTPADYSALNDGDTDFGSGGIMLLPVVPGQAGPPLAVAMGKSSILYLLDQTSPGGLEGTNSGPLQQQSVHCCGVWGGPAYYQGPNGGLVYYQTGYDFLRAYRVKTGIHPSLTDVADGTSDAGYGGSLPIISSNGAVAGSGIVWLIRRSSPLELEAYDALKLGPQLFQANAGVWTSNTGSALVTPLQANGRVYVPAYKTVSVFGLTD